MRSIIAVSAALLAGCSTSGIVEVSQDQDRGMDCYAIAAEIQGNKVRMETLSERSMNMLSGAWWFEDQATKAQALEQRNVRLATLSQEHGCNTDQPRAASQPPSRRR